MLKKLIASFLVFALLFVNTAVPVIAAGPWYNQNFSEWSKKVNSPDDTQIFGERYTAAQVQWVVFGLINLVYSLPGPFMPKLLECSGENFVAYSACASTVLVETGLLADSKTNNIAENETLVQAVFKERPISAISYVKDVGRNLKIVPEANAQTAGFGFSALNPILDLWKAARNICYALLVLVIIVMSFMIMFKVKINPQTIITVQSAIPKVVIAMILITFSYAIAGLLVDLMYVVFGLLGLALSSINSNLGASPVTFFNLMTKGQPFGGDINLGVWGLFLVYLIYFVISVAIVLIGSLGLVTFAAAGLIATIVGVATAGIMPLITIVLIAIVFIIMLIAMIRTVWALIKTTASVLLLTVAAPFQILLGTVVTGLGFTSWFKSFIASLATFVTIGFLFQLCFLFLNAAWFAIFPDLGKGLSQLLFGTDPIIHPGEFTERGWPPLLGTGDGAVPMIFLGVSFAIFTIIPKAADIVQSFIKGQQFNYGAALNEATVQPFKTALNIGASLQKMGDIYERATGNRRIEQSPTGEINRTSGPTKMPKVRN